MKTAVAIVLIIMGSFLLVVPVVFDLIHEYRVVSSSVSLPNSLEGYNRLGYWITGGIMILVGVLTSFRPRAAVGPVLSR